MNMSRRTETGHRMAAVVGTADPTMRFARMMSWFESSGFDVELLLWTRKPDEIPTGSLSQYVR